MRRRLAEELIHHEPKKKPPRHDLRKLRVDKSDPDFNDTENDPDLQPESEKQSMRKIRISRK